MRNLVFLPSILLLPACSLLGPSDEREGIEDVAACVERVTELLPVDKRANLSRLEGSFAPTYTYDITKLSLDEVKQLTVPGSDETAGRRLVSSTNTVPTAVAMFMKMPVDAKGAFFLGYDPALYRVRGAVQSAKDLLTAGCERQQANMRLIDVSWAPAASAHKTPENENNS